MNLFEQLQKAREDAAAELGLTLQDYNDYTALKSMPMGDINFQGAIQRASLKVLRLVLEEVTSPSKVKKIEARIRAEEVVEERIAENPVLANPCPTCKAKRGSWCKRPSGHSGPFVEFHSKRVNLLEDETE